MRSCVLSFSHNVAKQLRAWDVSHTEGKKNSVFLILAPVYNQRHSDELQFLNSYVPNKTLEFVQFRINGSREEEHLKI